MHRKVQHVPASVVPVCQANVAVAPWVLAPERKFPDCGCAFLGSSRPGANSSLGCRMAREFPCWTNRAGRFVWNPPSWEIEKAPKERGRPKGILCKAPLNGGEKTFWCPQPVQIPHKNDKNGSESPKALKENSIKKAF